MYKGQKEKEQNYELFKNENYRASKRSDKKE